MTTDYNPALTHGETPVSPRSRGSAALCPRHPSRGRVMETIVLSLGVAVCIALMGAFMVYSGDYRLLHGYHYATTPVAERPALARETGGCLIGTGVSIALITPTILPSWASIVGAVLLVASIAGMFVAVIRHNGALMSFAPNGSWPLMNTKPRMTMLACAAVGIVLSLLGIVPGVNMIATGDVSSLHSYHYANVAASDLPSLALVEGACMVALGAGMFACAIGCGGMTLRRPAPLWSKVLLGIGGTLFGASIIGALAAIVYFNGSLMG